MSPQEAVNNLGALRRRGALNDAEVKRLVDEKLRQVKGDKRVSTLKAKRAMQAVDLDAETARTLSRVRSRASSTSASPRRWR